MDAVVVSTGVSFPASDFDRLNRRHLDGWIVDLAKGEAAVRRLRKRLEALRNESTRACPVCGRPVAGRSDAVYCSSACRVRAHRDAHRRAALGDRL